MKSAGQRTTIILLDHPFPFVRIVFADSEKARASHGDSEPVGLRVGVDAPAAS